jgi:dipeptidyl aminopeptidase/acylaminoacyl peptidase
MQTDLSDGVRSLVKEGIADPGRVCIVGASYGGYAALAGVTLDPGVYRCAVSVAGPADLKRMLDWVNVKNRSGENYEQRYWDRFMGVTGPGDPVLSRISPIDHVDAINVPVLLITVVMIRSCRSSRARSCSRRCAAPKSLLTSSCSTTRIIGCRAARPGCRC